MQSLSVVMVQSHLQWEQADSNLAHFDSLLSGVAPGSDLIVLPEMFTTGFSMHPAPLAQSMEGPAMQWMLEKARDKQAVVTGSIIVKEEGRYFNRLIWMPPDGNYLHYDKYHLFSYSGENASYTRGRQMPVFELKDWKIRPMICYDLRFPAWCRNTYSPDTGFAYDVLLNVANWPAARSHAWRVMLMSRAIENQSYVIGVNRVGVDGNDIEYTGDSVVLDPLGESISAIMPGHEAVETAHLPACQLKDFREKFRVWNDWDRFHLNPPK